MLRHSKELNDFDKEELISLISEFLKVTKEVKRQKNRYAQIIMKKISLKTAAPAKRPPAEPKPTQVKQLEELPQPQQPIFLFNQLPAQTVVSHFQPQPQLFFQAAYDPSYYTIPSYQPQQLIYYVVATAPAPNLSVSKDPVIKQ